MERDETSQNHAAWMGIFFDDKFLHIHMYTYYIVYHCILVI